MNKGDLPTIRDLFPHFTDIELEEAEDIFDRYLALVLRIFDRLEPQTDAASLTPDAGALPLTASGSNASGQPPPV
jgi:hypothetical protein